MKAVLWVYCSDSRHQAGVLIPTQQRVLTTQRRGSIDIGPASQERLMLADSGQLSSDSTIHILHQLEVCGEENIKVSLVNKKAS